MVLPVRRTLRNSATVPEERIQATDFVSPLCPVNPIWDAGKTATPRACAVTSDYAVAMAGAILARVFQRRRTWQTLDFSRLAPSGMFRGAAFPGVFACFACLSHCWRCV